MPTGEGQDPDQGKGSDGDDQAGHGRLYAAGLAGHTVRTIHQNLRTFTHDAGKRHRMNYNIIL